MKFSTNTLWLVSALAMAGSSVSASSSIEGLPPNHPPVRGMNTLTRFSSQFRCPYSKEWLTKGAHQAAIDLGLTTPEKIEVFKQSHDGQDPRRRFLQEASASAPAMGSCSFTNQWTGPSCLEFRGEGWTASMMEERCAVEQGSNLTQGGEGCPKPSELAGWCIKEGGDNAWEATSMMISPMSDCDGNKMACQNFVGGAFEAASGCGGGEAAAGTPAMGGGDYASMGSPSGGAMNCQIAPGAIGAAHQSGFSEGYSNTCPGTPAEASPYMWPMAWSADIDTQSLAFGYDEVMHHTKLKTFYRLDKNWKRSDTKSSKGVLRTIGQGPCTDINTEMSTETTIACNSDTDISRGDPLETMIHRGNKMYFITWKTDTRVEVGATDPSLIADCVRMDLGPIGNIRPDWFLDNRGDDTDVQYLGDQHVYYASNVPRLTKQWRKKDFASQYFTMGVAGNPPRENATENESINWPLILNIPGEGFGDDMLQSYFNHSLLTDEDDDLFLLIENLEASGGSCPMLSSGDDSSFGPPTNTVHVPSNLEVDENSWFTNVYTFSPVWQPPMKIAEEMAASSSGMALTDAGRVQVESCYDPTQKTVKLSIEFQDIEAIATDSGMQLPWMSIGYRPDEVCAMNPADGSDTKLIMVTQSPTDNFPNAYAGRMGPATKGFLPSALNSIYDSLWPLGDAIGFSGVSLVAPMLGEEVSAMMISKRSSVAAPPKPSSASSVLLSFQEQFDQVPESLHLMYAIGSSPTLGFHSSRSCFEVKEFPICSSTTSSATTGDNTASKLDGILSESGEPMASTVSSSSNLSTFFAGVVVCVGSLLDLLS